MNFDPITEHTHDGVNSRPISYTNLTDKPAATTDATITTSDITTNDVSITKHGFAPKAPNDTTKFLRGDATWAVAAPSFKTGNTTHDMSSTTTTTIAHGLGTTPKGIRIYVNRSQGDIGTGAEVMPLSIGAYDGSTQNCNYTRADSNGNRAASGQDTSHIIHYGYGGDINANTDILQGTASVDATNITIAWSKSASPTGTGNIIWEAFA